MKVKLIIGMILYSGALMAGTVEKTYHFNRFSVEQKGIYQSILFENSILAGVPGEPSIPRCKVFLALPPGETAVSMEISWEQEHILPGKYLLFPQQEVLPISEGSDSGFLQKKAIYSLNAFYPASPQGRVRTQYLNGFAIALSSFTPLRYNPATGEVRYYGLVKVRIITAPDERSFLAMKNLPQGGAALKRIAGLVENPDILGDYPEKDNPQTTYQYLIVSPPAFKTEFAPLTGMYNARGVATKIAGTDSIYTHCTGADNAEKIRNFIISEHQQHGVEYVLLAGNPPLIPYRGFYCYVVSGGGYEDSNIPADLYYSGIDGNYNADGDNLFGEVSDDPDLLPDLSVGRFPVNDTAGLHRVIRKTVAYLTNPVLGEMNKPLLAGEYLYNNPITYGSTYMNLLIGNHDDNGYFTYGIPPAENSIDTLYDSPGWNWSYSLLLSRLNQGRSVVHHLGHSNTTYMMRLSMSQITNANFAAVNGTTHNYQILYTQGCYPGAFDASGGCIAAKCLTIDNFLAAGVFNSRYGWFNQGTSDGPSEHLEREFVSAIYNDSVAEKHVGAAHMISKIAAAPWIGDTNEFEPGAQRWVHYDCNLLGDPALEIWTAEPTVFSSATWTGAIDSNWNNPGNWNPAVIPTSLYDLTIAPSANQPVFPSGTPVKCHNLTIQNGASLGIMPGKTLIVYGIVTMEP